MSSLARASTRRRKTRTRELAELVLTVAIAVGVAVLVQAFLVKPYRIPSGSMIPTLAINQRILVDRLDTSPALGDIAVFHPPVGAGLGECASPDQGQGHPRACDKANPAESRGTPFVKRVVGLPGDRLRIVNGKVFRNGVEERGKYLQPCADPTQCTFPQTITVPAGHYYMMGDNRAKSEDSRFWGPVPKAWIIGTAFLTYWPLNRIGTL